MQSEYDDLDIAVIGMSCRFPGAKNIEEFWSNLVDGTESITFFTDKDLLGEGVDASLLNDPRYVKAASMLEEVDLSVDELESLRLCDLKSLDQIKAAKKMGVSQSTLQRILSSAHKKIAEALIEAKAIRINKREV